MEAILFKENILKTEKDSFLKIIIIKSVERKTRKLFIENEIRYKYSISK
jgi:hypothetical protein